MSVPHEPAVNAGGTHMTHAGYILGVEAIKASEFEMTPSSPEQGELRKASEPWPTQLRPGSKDEHPFLGRN